jgi:hypothetical protein
MCVNVLPCKAQMLTHDLSTYSDCGWIFAQHFCNRLGPAYLQLKNILDESNPAHAEVLNNIKRRFREETYTRESIEKIIHAYPELISLLYVNFAMIHYPAGDDAQHMMYVCRFHIRAGNILNLRHLNCVRC